jgi:DNA-binding transcriptional ArsR family regulator
MITGAMEKTTSINKLTALSHGGRLEIFRLLVGAGAEGLNAGEISSALDLRPNTLSAHLTMLSSAELIRSQREGRNIRYFAEMSAMRELLGYLLQDCCGGNPDIVKPALDSIRCHGRERPCS